MRGEAFTFCVLLSFCKNFSRLQRKYESITKSGINLRSVAREYSYIQSMIMAMNKFNLRNPVPELDQTVGE